MNNPQLEDGYIRIATEIWEALCRYRIPGEQRQVLDFIIRKTYGWKKKQDRISLSQFVEATGIKKQNVHRAIKSLEKRNIINVIKSDDYQTVTYGFNKHYTTWVTVIKSDYRHQKRLRPSSKVITQPSSKVMNTIDTITIDTSTKDKLHPSQKNGLDKKAIAVLRYLNRRKKSKYTDYKNILARLKEGKTIQECLTIIDNKFQDTYFQDHPKFLNPTTLFRKSHWDKYINETPDKTQHDKLLEVGNKWLKKRRMNDF